MFDSETIAFVGGGIMAEAMIKGLLNESLVVPEHVIASGPREARGQQLAARYAIEWTTDNTRAVAGRDGVILSVKPQVMPQVLAEVNGLVKPDALVISIAAGVSVARRTEGLSHGAVVRAMPNTPAQIGEGITVWVPTPDVTDTQLDQANAILGALGETVSVTDESYLDMATALSGTGPAYVLLFMEAQIDAGLHMGFSRRIAQKLVMQTMRGTLAYAAESARHPATLRNEDTSPGGTSAEALYQLEAGGLRTVLARAVWAAYQRSAALGQGGGERLSGRGPEGRL
ncbi:MAG: pyrroline-5-carboxylate reductase [Anaerolineae bacterium]